MYQQKFYTFGDTAALKSAAFSLWSLGWEYDASAKILLLPVPSFDIDGRVRGGGRIEDIITDDTVIFGGNLKEDIVCSHRHYDLLKDPYYVAQNAAITAHCAVGVAMEHSKSTLTDVSVLVLGWGRIGKCLTKLLAQLGADVTVYARKEEDRAMLTALGYKAIPSLQDRTLLREYTIIINTIPVPMICKGLLSPGQIKIDLASIKGIEGDDVIWARGLPNTYAPESSGALIAKTVDRIGKELLL